MARQRSPYELARSGDAPQTRSGREASSSIIGSHAALGPVIALAPVPHVAPLTPEGSTKA